MSDGMSHGARAVQDHADRAYARFGHLTDDENDTEHDRVWTSITMKHAAIEAPRARGGDRRRATPCRVCRLRRRAGGVLGGGDGNMIDENVGKRVVDFDRYLMRVNRVGAKGPLPPKWYAPRASTVRFDDGGATCGAPTRGGPRCGRERGHKGRHRVQGGGAT